MYEMKSEMKCEIRNMKSVPQRKIVQWIIKSYESLSKEIINSIKSSALRLAFYASKDDKISCFHEVKKTSDE